MKKAIPREPKHAFGDDHEAARATQAQDGKTRSRLGKGRMSQRKLPNFLANLERLGYTESEGAAFLRKFAHDAVL